MVRMKRVKRVEEDDLPVAVDLSTVRSIIKWQTNWCASCNSYIYECMMKIFSSKT